MLFSDYLEFWLQWKRKSWEEVTYSGYCQNVRSWIEPYFAKRKVRLNEITVLDIEMFYTHEINQRGVSGNTVLHYHANIRKALSDAAKLKLIPYNPAAEVERPKKDNFVASYYSADELMEVLPIFANTKMELPVMLAAFYGLRRSEVIGLQWSAIDFERKIVTISRTFERINVDGKMVDVSKCRTKNKASFRSLPLIPAVEQALLKAQKRQHQHGNTPGMQPCEKGAGRQQDENRTRQPAHRPRYAGEEREHRHNEHQRQNKGSRDDFQNDTHGSYLLQKFDTCLYMYIITPQEGANKDDSGPALTGLYSDFPHLPSYGVSIPHGEQCPAALPPVIHGDHPLGLPGHVTVALHKA